MDFRETEEQRALRSQVRSWLTDHPARPPADAEEAEQFAFRREFQRDLYEAGFLGLAWPTEYGGHGKSFADHLVVMDELAEVGAADLANIAGLELFGPTILEFGTEEQKRRFLPKILSGEEIWCQGFSEPQAGSDLASLRTTGRLEGDEFVVNGQKVWTSGAHRSDWIGFLARTDPDAARHEGISMLMSDMRTPGIEARPIVQINGDVEFSEVFFTDAHVPAQQILGPLHGGWKVAMGLLRWERGPIALMMLVRYRNSIGRLLELHAGLDDRARAASRRGLAELWSEVEALRIGGRWTAARIEEGDLRTEHGSLTKLFMAPLDARLHEFGLDLVGPEGILTDGADAGWWDHEYWYGLAASIYGGTIDIQRSIVAQRVLGLPRA